MVSINPQAHYGWLLHLICHTMPTSEIPIQENVACNRCLSLQYCQVASTIILTAVRHRIAIAISGG